MFAVYSLLLLLLPLQESYDPPSLRTAPAPRPPITSVHGGGVLLDVRVGLRGGIRDLRQLYGSSPFSDRAIEAVNQWTFVPARAGAAVESRVSIFMLFRSRSIFPTVPITPLIAPHGSDDDRPPLPVTILDPGYPVTSTEEGVVILELRIDAAGDIGSVEVIRGMPVLDEWAEDRLRSSTFLPALADGVAVPGTCIVAISFLRPVVVTEP